MLLEPGENAAEDLAKLSGHDGLAHDPADRAELRTKRHVEAHPAPLVLERLDSESRYRTLQREIAWIDDLDLVLATRPGQRKSGVS